MKYSASIPFMLLVTLSFGCTSSREDAIEPAADQEHQAAQNPPQDDADEALMMEQASIISNSVIDTTEQGLIYRQTLREIDEGTAKDADEVADDLRRHPTYGVLGEAIDAVMATRAGDHEQAMQIAEKLSTISVMQPESHMIAGDVFRHQGRLSDAIRCYQNAVDMNPGLARGHRWLGAIYYDTGAMQLATRHLRTVAKIDVEDYRTLRLAGLIHYEYQNFREAASDYQRALRRSPPPHIEQEIRLELADSLRELRFFEKAAETLAPCPETADVLAARAQINDAAGNPTDAATDARAAVELDSENRIANLVLGRLLLADRQAGSAIGHLETAVAAKPSDHEARFLLGQALVRAGKREEGEAQMARSTELKEAFLKMANLHLDAVDRPEDVDVRLQLAQLNEQSGRTRLAMTWYRAVLGLDPTHEEARRALTRLTAAQE